MISNERRELRTKKPLNRISVPRRSITPAGFALTTGVRINTIFTAHDYDIEDLSARRLLVYMGCSQYCALFHASRERLQDICPSKLRAIEKY